MKIDIFNIAQNAYKVVIAERRYLLRLCLVPVIIKIIMFTVGLSAGDQGDILWMTIYMVPAFLAEGWMLSHFVRLLVLGQRWPFQPSGDMEADLEALSRRAEGIIPGTVAYTLINVLIGGFFAYTMSFMPETLPQAGDEVDPKNLILMGGVLGVMIFGFRYLWLYIPLAAGGGIRSALKKTVGFSVFAAMFALWLICSIPAFMGAQLFGNVIFGSLGAMEQGSAFSSAAGFIVLLVNAVVDTIKNLIVTAGMTYLLLYLMQNRQMDKKDS